MDPTLFEGNELLTVRTICLLTARAEAWCKYHVWVAEVKPRMVWDTTLFRTPEVHWLASTGIQAENICWFCEASSQTRVQEPVTPVKPVHVSTTSTDTCVACKTTKHPLYHCSTFCSLTHDEMTSLLKSNNLCLNCFKSGHFVRQSPSLHWCQRCHGAHHTLLHVDSNERSTANPETQNPPSTNATSLVTTDLKTDSLLMTCHVTLKSPNGLSTEVCGLLDSASSVSFISEQLAQRLHLPCTHQSAQISGIAGLSHHSHSQSIASLSVSSVYSRSKEISVTTIVVPKITCDLPTRRVSIQSDWKHLSGL